MTVTLIGGEMLLWSDLDARHGPPPAGGAALLPLLSSVTGRTLVAGPHAPALVAALPSADVTVLVRGVADAEAFGDRTVLCGSLEKVATEAYDTVIALDGLDRLRSAEADDAPWDETLAQLVALLRDAGRLLLGVPNLFGLHRIVALPPAPADADWVVPDDHDPRRPGGLTDLRSRLAAAGLTVAGEYAAYPAPGTPSVLLGPAVLAEPSLTGFVEATLAAAVRPSDVVLTDPARLAAGALRAGVAAELAPAWVVQARRVPAGKDAEVAPRPLDEAEDPVGRWPDAVVVAGDRVREIRLPDADLPRGRTLETLLLAAAQQRDLPAMRAMLTGWQTGPAAGVPAGQVVVAPDGSHTALTAAGEPLVALRAFAAAVIAGGYAHLWPAPADEAELTALLAGMTGRELEPADVPAAVGARPPAVGELLAERDRLTRELTEAHAKHEWYERMLLGREAELKRVRRMNALLSATVPGKAATTLVGGLRAGKRAVRAVVRRTRG